MRPLALKSQHINSRVKKKSEECILFLWDGAFNHVNPKFVPLVQNSETSVSTKIASIITDSALGEKAIIGRFSLMVKRIQYLSKPKAGEKVGSLGLPHQVLIGKNYHDMTEFGC
jgi:hypothetical protein